MSYIKYQPITIGTECKPVALLEIGSKAHKKPLGDGIFQLYDGDCFCLDFGKFSVGGNLKFTVKNYSGAPRLRFSYFDRKEDFSKSEVRQYGDFRRGSCTYLGIELPVMPANPNRFENFDVVRTGDYFYPLIQGQQRFVSVECFGGSVLLSSLSILYSGYDGKLIGTFTSSQEKLDRLFLASANTINLATVKAHAVEKLQNVLAVRKLTKGTKLHKINHTPESEYTIDCVSETYRSDGETERFGIAFALHGENGYAYIIEKDKFSFVEFIGQQEKILSETPFSFQYNHLYHVTLSVTKSGCVIQLDGTIFDQRTGNFEGQVGIYTDVGSRTILWKYDLQARGIILSAVNNPELIDCERTDWYLSDGAKRDRLPWSGDLYWAFDSGWYAFGHNMKAYETLKILARNQNPEGFIFATCYPENELPPETKDYGYYQSDMFSAWFVVSALHYYQLSGDERVLEFYPNITACLDYLCKYIDKSDGLFYQRYETSKGLWDHRLGDVGKNTYTNLVLWHALFLTADFADRHSRKSDALEFYNAANALKKAINTRLYSEKLGGFVKNEVLNELCDMANPYAMLSGFADKTQAKRIAEQAEKITHAYGKILILMIKGLFRYGYPEKAYDMLLHKTPMITNGEIYSYVDWFGMLDSDSLPETVYECMHNPPHDFGAGFNWGDLSHPDSGISGVLSGNLGGVLPLTPGFEDILLKPYLADLNHLEITIPTLHGNVVVQYVKSDEEMVIDVNKPTAVKIHTDFSNLKDVIIKYNERSY